LQLIQLIIHNLITLHLPDNSVQLRTDSRFVILSV